MNLTQKNPERAHYESLSQAQEFFIQHARINGRSRKTLDLYAWVFETLRGYLDNPPLDELDTLKLNCQDALERAGSRRTSGRERLALLLSSACSSLYHLRFVT